MVLEML